LFLRCRKILSVESHVPFVVTPICCWQQHRSAMQGWMTCLSHRTRGFEHQCDELLAGEILTYQLIRCFANLV
jgi:hypothetical protein